MLLWEQEYNAKRLILARGAKGEGGNMTKPITRFAAMSVLALAAGLYAGTDAWAQSRATGEPTAGTPTGAHPKGTSKGPRLAMPQMSSKRGRKLFASKGCVACHSINGVGGIAGPNLDAHTMKAFMHPYEFAAKMWRGASAMIALQKAAFGEQLTFSGDELADIIAFAHDHEEQHKFSMADIPVNVLALMDHVRTVPGGTGAHRDDGHKRARTPESRLAVASLDRFAASAVKRRAGNTNIPVSALPVATVMAKVTKAGFVNVRTIEYKRKRYEVTARNAKGKDVLLVVDPTSGAIKVAKISAPKKSAAFLPVDKILKEVEGAGFTRVSSIAVRNMIYRVVARDAKKRTVRVLVNPKTGSLVRHPTTAMPIMKVMDGAGASPKRSLADIVSQVTAAGFSDVYSIEPEYDGYKIEARTTGGGVVLLYYDIASGDLLRHP